MPNATKIIAIACADIHLQHTPPACRAVEPDWYTAMQRPLDELTALAHKYDVPILCAGDIFDRWNSPPELINWAIDHLPFMYTIPGQHDLPQHNYDDIYKSAYETLERAKIIESLPVNKTLYKTGEYCVAGFPWGFPIGKSKDAMHTNKISIAIAHEYNWIPDHSYPTANPEQRLSKKRKNLLDFDVVIFGDNHKGFHTTIGKTSIFNCGTLMRRKIDEIDYRPQVGLIYSDGSVVPHYLDISQDKLDVPKINNTDENNTMDISDFMAELESLSQNPLDFQEAIKQYLQTHETDDTVQTILLEAMGQ